MKREFQIYGILLLVVGLAIVILRSLSLLEYKLTLGDLLVNVLTFIITMMVAEFINSILLHQDGQFTGSGKSAGSRGLRRLLQDMKSPDAAVRREAADQFGSLVTEIAQVKTAVGALKSDADSTVQQAAADALANYHAALPKP